MATARSNGGLRYAHCMQPRACAATILAAINFSALAFLAGCGGDSTGGYPPPPPAYVPPAAEMEKAAAPKFQPLIKALLTQRRAAKGDLSGLAKSTDANGQPLSSFAASRAASDALTAALSDAQLTADERATWSMITSLDDEALAKLVK
jgi:hypothetical protein